RRYTPRRVSLCPPHMGGLKKCLRMRRSRMHAHAQRSFLCEVEVPYGLEAIACDEIERRLGARVDTPYAVLQSAMDGRIRFLYTGDLMALLTLGTVQTASIVLQFAGPRPRALLGDAAIRAMLQLIGDIRGLWPRVALT